MLTPSCRRTVSPLDQMVTAPPPARVSLRWSKTLTSWPSRSNPRATEMPLTPAPTTSIRSGRVDGAAATAARAALRLVTLLDTKARANRFKQQPTRLSARVRPRFPRSARSSPGWCAADHLVQILDRPRSRVMVVAIPQHSRCWPIDAADESARGNEDLARDVTRQVA